MSRTLELETHLDRKATMIARKRAKENTQDGTEFMILQDILNDVSLRKRLAKFLVLHCFRNSQLENLHTGVTPSSKSGDYTDVRVVTPFGEIPWLPQRKADTSVRKVSRISDGEMKELMISAVNQTYAALTHLADEEWTHMLGKALEANEVLPRWEEPTDYMLPQSVKEKSIQLMLQLSLADAAPFAKEMASPAIAFPRKPNKTSVRVRRIRKG